MDSTVTFVLSGTPANNSLTTNAPFGVTFGAAPNVQVSFDALDVVGSGEQVIYGIDSVTASACSSYMSFIGTPGGTGEDNALIMHLRSEGTIAL